MECICQVASVVAGAQYGDTAGVLVHFGQRRTSTVVHARSGGPGTELHPSGKTLLLITGFRDRPGYTTASRLDYGCKPAIHTALWSVLSLEMGTHSIHLRYQTLDNLDGKQARRTGTSSGLGELFE